jgi:hypothetical protein
MPPALPQDVPPLAWHVLARLLNETGLMGRTVVAHASLESKATAAITTIAKKYLCIETSLKKGYFPNIRQWPAGLAPLHLTRDPLDRQTCRGPDIAARDGLIANKRQI